MEVRVVTMKYAEGVQGFPEDALHRACAGREVLDFTEHYFVHGGVPHLALVLKLDGASAAVQGGWKERTNVVDPELGLSDADKQLYRALKKWRNERANKDGKPAYAIARNVLVLEIVKARPKTLAALKEISGIGEGMVSEYGKEIVEIVSNQPAVAPAVETAVETKPAEGGESGK